MESTALDSPVQVQIEEDAAGELIEFADQIQSLLEQATGSSQRGPQRDPERAGMVRPGSRVPRRGVRAGGSGSRWV
jgi:hypothetical protein